MIGEWVTRTKLLFFQSEFFMMFLIVLKMLNVGNFSEKLYSNFSSGTIPKNFIKISQKSNLGYIIENFAVGISRWFINFEYQIFKKN